MFGSFRLVCLILVVAATVYALVVYFRRSTLFKKGKYGRYFVNKALKRFAAPRKMTVLQDVTIKDGEHTAHFDHVLIGYFGVLFLQSIQGSGSFWADAKQENWAFTDGSNAKLIFKNPLKEMDEKIAVFRQALSRNKIYNVPVDSSVVVVTLGEIPKMYLSNISNPNAILIYKKLKEYLSLSKFEQDNGVNPEQIAALFHREKSEN